VQAFRGVRDAEITGVFSPTARRAEELARYARELDLGPAKRFKSIARMVEDKSVDAIWLAGPNHTRVENVEEIESTPASPSATAW